MKKVPRSVYFHKSGSANSLHLFLYTTMHAKNIVAKRVLHASEEKAGMAAYDRTTSIGKNAQRMFVKNIYTSPFCFSDRRPLEIQLKKRGRPFGPPAFCSKKLAITAP